MIFKYKANYFLATLGGGISFDDKGEFKTEDKTEIQMLKDFGAVVVTTKKTTKKK